jgi:hypothetical protein
MPKRIQVFPPNGGEPIEIWDQDLASMEAKGWRTESPRSSKPKAAKAKAEIAETETQKEE